MREFLSRLILLSNSSASVGFALLCICITTGAAVCWGAVAEDELPRQASRFTMGRVQYATLDFGFMGRRRSMEPPWHHDWPRGEQHLMKIVGELTKLDVNPGGHIFSFDAEDAFKYPIAYLCEVGFLDLSERETHNMREYLLRGGFLIVDDFRAKGPWLISPDK